MNDRCVRLWFAALALAGVLVPAGQPARAEAPEASLTLAWQAAAPELTQAGAGWQVSVPGFAATEMPGQPRLPFAAALLAVPAGAVPVLEILDQVQAEQALPGPLALTPGDASAPAGAYEPVALAPAGVVRGVTLVRVVFYPAVPRADRLLVTRSLRVRVRFAGAAPLPAEAGPPDPLLAAVRQGVANPEMVPASAPAPSAGPLLAAASNTSPVYLVETSTPGLTALTYAALAEAGFPVAAVDPAALRLEHAGAEVAAEWEGDLDAQFEPGERLLFYAAPRFNRYTRQDGYRLSVASGAPARRMALRSAAPVGAAAPAWRSVLAEQNSIYYALNCRCAAGRDGERWMWDYLAGPVTRAYALAAPDRAAGQAAVLTVWLVGYTHAQHQAAVSLNGVALGAAQWSGQQAYTFTVPIPAGVLLAGANSVTLSVAALDGLWLDALAVDYPVTAQATAAGAEFTAGPRGAEAAAAPALGARLFLPLLTRTFTPAAARTVQLAAPGPYRVYDLTDPDSPLRLTDIQTAGQAVTWAAPSGGAERYLVASEADIRAPAAIRPPAALPAVAGADYLVIAPADLTPALAPLLALRQAQGLTTAVADAQAVYDAYDAGRPTPAALRAFLAAVYAAWSPRPQYVLLVGDATFDPKRYRADSQLTRLPAQLAEVDPWMGETADDNDLAAVDGADRLPDFLLGRLPVTALTETQAVVSKLVAYEAAPPAGDWPARALFVADDADPAGDFAAQAQAWAGLLPVTITTQAIYHGLTTATVTETQQAVRAAWDLGAGLVVYNGHSSQRQWAAERLFHLDDVSGLANAGRLPVVLQMTCLTGAFHDAGRPALDEALLRQPQGGAVGVWGPTGLGVTNGHDVLAAAFLERVFQGGPVTAGAAALAGKLALAQNGQHLDLIETFTWLGDPATHLHLAAGP